MVFVPANREDSLKSSLSDKFSWKSFLTEVAYSCFLLFLFNNNGQNFLKSFKWFAQLILPVSWESCHWILPPWQQTSYIMAKSQKLIILSSGVWWGKAISCVAWEAESDCVQGDLFLFIHSCNKFVSSTRWKEPHIWYLETWVPALLLASWVTL
jgi:hypothetical protein